MHRIVVVKESTDEVVGILGQLELVKFLWENSSGFPNTDHLYPQNINVGPLESQFNAYPRADILTTNSTIGLGHWNSAIGIRQVRTSAS